MAGLCGVLGEDYHQVDWMANDLRWTGEEEVDAYDDRHLTVRSVYHPGAAREQPASTEDGTLVWVWGDIWGSESSNGYRSRPDGSGTVAGFLTERYEECGIDAVAGLNGSFAAVIYDRGERTAYLITDRLGTHPIYYVQAGSGEFVFSTKMQSLPSYPGIGTAFDVDYLCEYLTLGAVGGVRTPLAGVEELLPSSVTTVDLDTGRVKTERYWQPRFDPLDKPFSYFARRFRRRFQAALDDRLSRDLRYGLLLSGGSDSRAILAGIDDDVDVITYHATDWLSRETRTATRVAAASKRELRLLTRDRHSHERMLEATPPMMNFQGRFNQAHITEFGDQLREEVDVLISGLGADTLFRDHAFSVPTLSLGMLGTPRLPFAESTESVEQHIARRAIPLPEYLSADRSLEEILRLNIEVGDDIVHHGVPCRSVAELVFFDDFYPFSNKSDFFYHALNGIMPHWSPFLDNRLVELGLRLPLKHRVRRNVVNATAAVLDRSLASIPHAETGVPLTSSFPASYVRRVLNQARKKYLPTEDPPEPYMGNGPWVNGVELIRMTEFVGEALQEAEPIMESLPFLNSEGAHRCHEAHLSGTDNYFQLYTLLSFLRMPVTDRATKSTETRVS
jgi:asparagine synthase (glutamine-hydrolysing)